MAQKNYLQLVNEAMAESKASLTQLTSLNFATENDSHLYARFREWVNMAYEELVNDRPEWFFRNERAAVTVRPRLILSGLTYTPSVGDTLIGQSSGVMMTVQGVHTFEEAEQNSSTEVTVSVSFDQNSDPSSLVIRESLDRLAPITATNVGYLLGMGRYAFEELVPGLQDIDIDSVVAHNGDLNSQTVVAPIPWGKWSVSYDMTPFNGQVPMYISRTPQGSYALYPQPETTALLTFDYTRKIQLMSAATDYPEALPERFHGYLVWRAIQEFADFDNNGKLYQRASKHVERFRNWMERDMLPDVGIIGWNGVIKRG